MIPTIKRLVFARTLATSGRMLGAFALPWLAFTVTGSPVALVVVAIEEVVIDTCFSLLGGGASDQRGIKAILVGTEIATVIITIIAGAWATLATLPISVLYVLAALLSAASSLQGPAAQAAVAVIAHDDLDTTNAILQKYTSILGLVCPPLAGVLIAAFGSGPTLLVDAGTLFASTLLLSSMSFPLRKPSSGGLLSAISAGIRTVWNLRPLRSLSFLMTALHFAAGPCLVLLMAYARDILHIGARGTGILFTCGALGSLCAASVSVRVVRRLGRVNALMLGYSMIAPALLGLWRSHSIISAIPCFMLLTFGAVLGDLQMVTIRQSLVPTDTAGSAIAASRILSRISRPVSLVMAALVVSHDLGDVYLAGAGLSAIALCIFFVAGLAELRAASDTKLSVAPRVV